MLSPAGLGHPPRGLSEYGDGADERVLEHLVTVERRPVDAVDEARDAPRLKEHVVHVRVVACAHAV